MGIVARTRYVLKCDWRECGKTKHFVIPREADLSPYIGDWTVEIRMEREDPALPGIPVVRSVFCPEHAYSDV